ncbi:mitogen-activated protein kinase kinase kinase 20-related [Anaeramoeba flamelloides]|uniref:Mitogen-activated protein kinase kinase kinase 20-related n=1 Tax=Anaeramoeba flamelloides TaxID=1746091 RepID=A0AAV7Y769_9EUKA|nr:mitogen-activated protein kinase kinase kinase 20-related [Anaeramoeba flamelloides]
MEQQKENFHPTNETNITNETIVVEENQAIGTILNQNYKNLKKIAFEKQKKNDFITSESQFQLILKYQTNDPKILFCLGLQNLSLGHLEKSKKQFQTILKLGTDQKFQTCCSCGLNICNGEFQEAELQCNSLKIDDHYNYLGYFFSGLIQEQSKQLSGALKNYYYSSQLRIKKNYLPIYCSQRIVKSLFKQLKTRFQQQNIEIISLSDSRLVRIITSTHTNNSNTNHSGGHKIISKVTFKNKQVILAEMKPRSNKYPVIFFFREALLLSQLSHPNIIKIIAVSLGKYKNKINDPNFAIPKPFFLMEYGSCGDLDEFLKSGPFQKADGFTIGSSKKHNLDLNLIISLSLQISNAVSYLHNKGIIHNDIKSKNFVVMSDFSIKLIDFGVYEMKENIKKKVHLTPNFCAPELLSGNTTGNKKTDIYSMGLVFKQMINSIDAKLGMTNENKQIGKYNMFENIINTCLQRDPEKRPSIDQVKNHLQIISNK